MPKRNRVSVRGQVKKLSGALHKLDTALCHLTPRYTAVHAHKRLPALWARIGDMSIMVDEIEEMLGW